jgi:acetyl esterase/lipase
MAPKFPFSVALEDSVSALADLKTRFDPHRSAIAGDSADGGLAYASLIKAREARQPMPACLVALSPWVNLGTENPSYDRLTRVDLLLSRAIIDYYVPLYVGHHEPRNPLISPLFADICIGRCWRTAVWRLNRQHDLLPCAARDSSRNEAIELAECSAALSGKSGSGEIIA